ncbi:alanyl-tRNA editing protein [Bacillus sp. FJAT-53711]|uniref:Alanyl-tRNA editing protein n=1 Tax=Bacillus yunxiaonensis TaxID=3127665 RepID=A0ABU8G1L6_9BACI
MTKKVFWDNPYLTELQTRITSVDGTDLTVEQTIFYAFSGGQESDTGTIGAYHVLQARKQQKEIIYTVEEGHTLCVNDIITMKIDWDRRYRLMRLHFAAEIILELVYKRIGDVYKIGAHIAQDKSRIDFEMDENISTYFPLLQQEANMLVQANYDIISSFSDEENERRTWEISEFSKVACGGTHLKKTGEIGEITLKRKNIGKGKERIEIYVA